MSTEKGNNNVQSTNGFTLSPQQKHLWLLQQEQRSLPYRLYCAILLKGSLDVKTLETAIYSVIDRHEALRTNYYQLPELRVPLQVVVDGYRPQINHYNLQNLDEYRKAKQLCDLQEDVLATQFDSSKETIFNISLVILSPCTSILIFGINALCGDRKTLDNFVHEVSAFYEYSSRGESILSEVVQYPDFSGWQNDIIDQEVKERGSYWRKKDIENRPTLSIPFKRQVSGYCEFSPSSIKRQALPDTIKRIEAIEKDFNIPSNIFILTCWCIYIGKLTNQPSITIGVTYDGRNYDGLEASFGLYTKCLPIQSHVSPKMKFVDFMFEVNNTIQTEYQWQEYFSWDQITKLDKTEHPEEYLRVCYEYGEMFPNYSAPELSFSLHSQYTCVDKFELKLFSLYHQDHLMIELHYDSELFYKEDIEYAMDHFCMLLHSASIAVDAEIESLQLTNDIENDQLSTNSDDINNALSNAECIHRMFERQAQSIPDKIAAVFENETISYGDLNAEANQLARYLRKKGVGPDITVAICVDRSLDAIKSLLAVLKAGGAYLSVDSTLPPERLQFILSDAQISVLVTYQDIADNFLSYTKSVVCLDSDKNYIEQEASENLGDIFPPEHLAYVLYTSGSTGKPKGVAIEHRQLFNYIDAIRGRLAITNGESFALMSTLSADLGNTMVFPALCTGGCLHVISQDRITNIPALEQYFNNHPIDYMKIVPSHLEALLAQSHSMIALLRRGIILGGEPCMWGLIRQVRKVNPGCAIINHYGPTETTVGVLTFPVISDYDTYATATVPLGRPIPNTQIFILDECLQPVPMWISGELYIGGASLGRGYLNRPDLTAERFVPNPYSNAPGARLYRTGDQARYRSDGTIEFVGRIDQQVKLRGFRIELGEVEAVLGAHTSIGQAVVMVREDVPGDKRLTAYVVAKPGASVPTADVLRSYLRTKLPDYMIPSAIVSLEALPLTPNGKLDRKGLPAPTSDPSTSGQTYIAPHTPLQEMLASIWADVLHLERCGIFDNFFELGGHSLLAMQLISRLREISGVEISVQMLFEYPTIAKLEAVIAQEQVQNDKNLSVVLDELEQLSEEEVKRVLFERGLL